MGGFGLSIHGGSPVRTRKPSDHNIDLRCVSVWLPLAGTAGSPALRGINAIPSALGGGPCALEPAPDFGTLSSFLVLPQFITTAVHRVWSCARECDHVRLLTGRRFFRAWSGSTSCLSCSNCRTCPRPHSHESEMFRPADTPEDQLARHLAMRRATSPHRRRMNASPWQPHCLSPRGQPHCPVQHASLRALVVVVPSRSVRCDRRCGAV